MEFSPNMDYLPHCFQTVKPTIQRFHWYLFDIVAFNLQCFYINLCGYLKMFTCAFSFSSIFIWFSLHKLSCLAAAPLPPSSLKDSLIEAYIFN